VTRRSFIPGRIAAIESICCSDVALGDSMKALIVAAAALSLGACATITRGTEEDVQFYSEPAGAEVKTSNGMGCPSTPCTLKIPRKDQFQATFELPGYHPESIYVSTRMSGGGAAGMVGNVVVGGIVGVVVDGSSGATMDHSPNPVVANLKPLRSVSPLIERRRRASVPMS
jgi:hypothetical protein